MQPSMQRARLAQACLASLQWQHEESIFDPQRSTVTTRWCFHLQDMLSPMKPWPCMRSSASLGVFKHYVNRWTEKILVKQGKSIIQEASTATWHEVTWGCTICQLQLTLQQGLGLPQHEEFSLWMCLCSYVCKFNQCKMPRLTHFSPPPPPKMSVSFWFSHIWEESWNH